MENNNSILEPLLKHLDISNIPDVELEAEQIHKSIINYGEQLLNDDEVNSFIKHCKSANKFLRITPQLTKQIRTALTEAISLGFSIKRFKNYFNLNTLSFKTLDSDFEEIINSCAIRIFLSEQDYKNWILEPSESIPEDDRLEQQLELMNDGLFYEMGIVYPQVQLKTDSSLPETYYRIEWNDFHFPPIKGLDQNKILVNDTVDRLTLLNITGEETINPANNNLCAFISPEYKETAEQAGLTTWNQTGYLILQLSSIIRRNAPAFVNKTFAEFSLSQLEKYYPDTIAQIKAKFSIETLTKILRGLLREEISVRHLEKVLDQLLILQSPVHEDLSKFIVFTCANNAIYTTKPGTTTKISVEEYVEMIRIHLKSYISHKYTRGGNTLVVYLIDMQFEKILKQQADFNDFDKTEILNAIQKEIGNLAPSAQQPVLLTTVEVRRKLKGLVAPEFPDLAVISYQELSPDLNIQPIARISPELKHTND